MISLLLFVRIEGQVVSKETQGAIRIAPASGSESLRGVMSLWGLERWERTPKARFPPAESPPIKTWEGLRPVLLRM